MYKRALISVYNKEGLVEFLKPLEGLEIVSTGGTAKHLRDNGFKVIDVESLTGFPSLFSGRVKTLHPHIYMSLLSRDWVGEDKKTLKDKDLKPFDLVIGNLYPFEEKKDLKDKELVEWIDIGGPCLLRAAAKNYFSITVLSCPEDYKLASKTPDLKLRQKLAAKVFSNLIPLQLSHCKGSW